jgi:phosphopantothenoylcysteine decarboxylase/phosphopantothenate--cysteine ligase
MVGGGRLAEIPDIVAAVLAAILAANPAPTQDLAHETFLITAGGTREALDAVRFLGNRSSGRMGYALAAAAARRGARVLLVSAAALPAPPGCEVLPVESAEQMRQAVLTALPHATVVIKAAAVADFRPLTPAPGKLPRAGTLSLELEATPDIARQVADSRNPGTLLVVFAAEVDPATAAARARAKLNAKGADAVFLNLVGLPGVGFDEDQNAGSWITANQEIHLPRMNKDTLAEKILDQLAALRALPANRTPA